ncbi:interleukin-27 subunit beta isoform X2 [Brachyhypopomus gauderio]|uniref:interleukin-27 subunit beta isoform X2 n=1 Tax=Brachyhypopomus gauderio TaxID=698409 RepID=UPI004042A35D
MVMDPVKPYYPEAPSLVLSGQGISQLCCGDAASLPPKHSTRELFVAIGSSVELSCGDGMAKDTEWRLNGSVLVSGPVLYLRNTSLEDQGIYTCHGPNGDSIETLHVWMGHAPSLPEVRCWSPSYPLKALCSWTQTPDPILPTHYIATYWYPGTGQQPLVLPCQRESDLDRQCVLEEFELHAAMPYVVNITAVNALGSATRILPILIEDIVKPDPPVEVKVTLQPGRKLLVRWSPPPTWPDPVNFTLRYKVEVQRDKHSIASIMGPYESESMVRSGLVAGRTYHIRVSAMDVLGNGQSSEWSDPVSITVPKS